jgi:hypothetical protein
MGPGKAFDPNKYFIFCANVMGSPYGSASPVTINPDTGELYGPEVPATTIRDDVRYVHDSIRRNRIHADSNNFLQVAQVSVGPSRCSISSSCDWRIHGRNGRPRVASLHRARFHSKYYPDRDVGPTLSLVHQLGRSSTPKHLQRPSIRRWLLSRRNTTTIWTRSRTHGCTLDIPLARLLRVTIWSQATETKGGRDDHTSRFPPR